MPFISSDMLTALLKTELTASYKLHGEASPRSSHVSVSTWRIRVSSRFEDKVDAPNRKRRADSQDGPPEKKRKMHEEGTSCSATNILIHDQPMDTNDMTMEVNILTQQIQNMKL